MQGERIDRDQRGKSAGDVGIAIVALAQPLVALQRQLHRQRGELDPGAPDLRRLPDCEIETPDGEGVGRWREAEVRLRAAIEPRVVYAVDQPAIARALEPQAALRFVQPLLDR